MAGAGHFLPLSHGQTMYYEVHGKVGGPVALVLHGGPGSGLSPRTVRMFDLKRWCVILYDQRGCGQSLPFGVPSLTHNTTDDLLDDMERLRRALGVKKWYLTGGSWGTTLALVYAEKYPHRVTGMLLRALCLMDDMESEWLYERHGAAQVYPAEYKRFLAPLTRSERGGTMKEILRAYQRRLTSPDKKVAQEAAAAGRGGCQVGGGDSEQQFLEVHCHREEKGEEAGKEEEEDRGEEARRSLCWSTRGRWQTSSSRRKGTRTGRWPRGQCCDRPCHPG